MEKKWVSSFLGVNTLIHRVGALLAVSTLLALGTSTPVMAKKPVCNGDGVCDPDENAKHCPADCSAGGGTASGLFVRADFPDVLTADGTPTAIQSDLEGAAFPNAIIPCGDYQYWDTRFDTTCQDASGSGPVSSTVTNGGRWHLRTVLEQGEDNSTNTDNRWVVFNWLETPDFSPCRNVDDDLYFDPPGGALVPPIDADPCVDNLEMRFLHCLEKVFAPGTTEDDVCIDLAGPRLLKQGTVLWHPFYTLTYLQPLFVLEDPAHPGDPDFRILTTKKNLMGEDRSLAELFFVGTSPSRKDDFLVGTYNMHLEVRLSRVD